jgi:hypothetical protein
MRAYATNACVRIEIELLCPTNSEAVKSVSVELIDEDLVRNDQMGLDLVNFYGFSFNF